MSRWDRWVGLPAARYGDEACYGFVRTILAEEFGVHWPRMDAVPEAPGARAALLQASRPLVDVDVVDWPEARAGDVVQMRHGPHPVHLGVLISPTDVLHLAHTGETVCVRLDDHKLRRGLVALWRPRRPA